MSDLFQRGSRRDLFRHAVGEWVERLMLQAEERVAPGKWHRPPGALPEVALAAACTRCDACINACPAQALMRVPVEGGLAAGTPYLDPRLQPCLVCADMPCAAACPTDALTVPETGWAGLRLAEVTFVPERCVTFEGIACGVCAASCPVGESALMMDEGGHPVLRREGCVGCGICVRACITSPSSFELTETER
ncbi:MAG TPA: 4Fe-4S dicluster domain-containing protein [Gemmatimonadales bacterium]|nr:4Fe-4S dicluster domain-containing protein [Gemmatimonadales bacterium]